MADGTITLPPDSTGTKLRTFTNAGVDGGAHQEVVSLALSDGTLDTTIAALLAGLRGAPAGTLDAIRALLAATLTIAGSVSVSNLPATQPVSGTVTANLGTIDGASTEATLALIKAKTDNLDVALSTRTKPADTQPVSGPVTDTQLRATPVPVSGTVATGLSQPLTDTQLRAAAVPVSAATLPLPAGASTEATLQNVRRALTDQETRLDYDVRTDGNPVYVGKALQGTATSAGGWTIQKLIYDASNRLIRAEVLTGIYDNRASLAW